MLLYKMIYLLSSFVSYFLEMFEAILFGKNRKYTFKHVHIYTYLYIYIEKMILNLIKSFKIAIYYTKHTNNTKLHIRDSQFSNIHIFQKKTFKTIYVLCKCWWHRYYFIYCYSFNSFKNIFYRRFKKSMIGHTLFFCKPLGRMGKRVPLYPRRSTSP